MCLVSRVDPVTKILALVGFKVPLAQNGESEPNSSFTGKAAVSCLVILLPG